MLSYGDGDEDAFDTLYRRYEKPLLDSIFPWYGYNDKSVDISIRPR